LKSLWAYYDQGLAMNTFKLYEQLKAAFPKESAEALAHVLSGVIEDIQNTVTKEDFAELKAVVRDLGEAQKRTEQRVEELAQAQKQTEQRVEELAQTMQAGFRELNARFGDLDARFGGLNTRFGDLDARFGGLNTRFGDLNGRFGGLQAGFRDLHARFGVVGSRWGDQAEEAFRRGLLETVSRVGYTVEHYQGHDPEGFINYTPRSYDLDVLVHDGQVVVAEVKSNASGADVTEFHRSVLLFERQTGRKASQRILVAVTIQAAAFERAKELGIIVATDFSPVIP
jgi:hypothetical protein